MDAEEWDARYTEHAYPWGFEPNKFIREHCERLPVGDALDLGCGDGRHALWLARLGWRVTGVDFSRVAIEQARLRTSRQDPYRALRLAFRQADVTTMRIKPRSQDLVVLSYLQLPVETREPLLLQAAAALRPHGHLVLVAHDARNIKEGVGGPQDPALLYESGPTARLLADEGGLVVEMARSAERALPDGVALDCVVRARRPHDPGPG